MYVTIGFNVPSEANPNEPDTAVYYNSNRVTPQPIVDSKYSPALILDSTVLSNVGVIFLPSRIPQDQDSEPTPPPTTTSGDNSITTTPRQISSVSYWDNRTDLGSYSIVPQYIEPMGAPKLSKTSTSYDLSSLVYSLVYAIDAIMLTSATLAYPMRNACTLTQN